MAKLSKLTNFLDRLDQAELHYTLSSIREGAVMIAVTLSGARWEVEFMADGDVEVEIFTSDGDIHGADMLDELFSQVAKAH